MSSHNSGPREVRTPRGRAHKPSQSASTEAASTEKEGKGAMFIDALQRSLSNLSLGGGGPAAPEVVVEAPGDAVSVGVGSRRSSKTYPPSRMDLLLQQQQQQSSHVHSSSSPLNRSFHSAPERLRPLRETSGEPLDFGIHEAAADRLRYTVWDLVALTSEEKSFSQLKKSLRQNGAVTNELLKQGLPLFMHKNRSTILRRYFRELEREQARAEKIRRKSILRADGAPLDISLRSMKSTTSMASRKSVFGWI